MTAPRFPSLPAKGESRGPNLRRLYRAHVLPHDWYAIERTVYVEAFSDRAAIQKIAGAIAAIELRSPAAIEERIYNCKSAQECIERGLSSDLELRLFETGSGPDGPLRDGGWICGFDLARELRLWD